MRVQVATGINTVIGRYGVSNYRSKYAMDELSAVVGVGTELTAANGERFLIRRATPQDREALCLVCLQTGDGGKDATSQFRDPLLLGRRWVLPYVELEPDLALCLVSLENNEVCGYALGCKDTTAFSKRLNDDYLPRMRKLYPKAEGISDDGSFKDAEVINDFYRFELPPEEVHVIYPSHMHIDLVPRTQGQNLGRSVLGSLLHTLRESGAQMIHLEMWISNERAGTFYQRCGFKKLQEVGTNVYLGLDARAPSEKSADEIFGGDGDEGRVEALLFGIRVALLEWHESHIRTGEKYDVSLCRTALACFERACEGPKAQSVKELVEISMKWGNYRPLCGSCSMLMHAIEELHGKKDDNALAFKLGVLMMSLLHAQVATKASSWESLMDRNPQILQLSTSMSLKKLNTTGTEWWRDPAQWEAVLLHAARYDVDPAYPFYSYPGYFRFFHTESTYKRAIDLSFGALESLLKQ